MGWSGGDLEMARRWAFVAAMYDGGGCVVARRSDGSIAV